MKKWHGIAVAVGIRRAEGGVYIPSNSGELLYAAAGEPKELWYAEDVGHCQFDIEKPEEYERRIVGFFDQYLLGR